MSTETAETNRDAVERSFELIQQGDVDALDEVIDEEVTLAVSGITDRHGIDAYKEYIESFRTAFPDLEFEMHDIVAEDDVVVVHLTGRGTHDGEFEGIEPTGNSFEERGMNLLRVRDGMIVEDINVWDNLSFTSQLGIDPSEL